MFWRSSYEEVGGNRGHPSSQQLLLMNIFSTTYPLRFFGYFFRPRSLHNKWQRIRDLVYFLTHQVSTVVAALETSWEFNCVCFGAWSVLCSLTILSLLIPFAEPNRKFSGNKNNSSMFNSIIFILPDFYRALIKQFLFGIWEPDNMFSHSKATCLI